MVCITLVHFASGRFQFQVGYHSRFLEGFILGNTKFNSRVLSPGGLAIIGKKFICQYLCLPLSLKDNPIRLVKVTAMQECTIAIGQNGRIVIPTAIRKALNLQEGQRLFLRLENESIIMEKPTDIVKKLQNRFRKIPVSLADELIQERRQEAAKENHDS
jgi:AbrB family looped-hinge helix DNA binding protein